MPRYLVEAYCAEETEGIARAARLRLAQRDPVRFVRSVFVQGDEICIHVLDAPSLEAAAAAIEHAEIADARIVEAIEWEANRRPRDEGDASWREQR